MISTVTRSCRTWPCMRDAGCCCRTRASMVASRTAAFLRPCGPKDPLLSPGSVAQRDFDSFATTGQDERRLWRGSRNQGQVFKQPPNARAMCYAQRKHSRPWATRGSTSRHLMMQAAVCKGSRPSVRKWSESVVRNWTAQSDAMCHALHFHMLVFW